MLMYSMFTLPKNRVLTCAQSQMIVLAHMYMHIIVCMCPCMCLYVCVYVRKYMRQHTYGTMLSNTMLLSLVFYQLCSIQVN